MFYEFTPGTRPQFSAPEGAPQARRSGGPACGSTHRRSGGVSGSGFWFCSLEAEHRGAHVAILSPGGPAPECNRVISFWDDEESTDDGTAGRITDYIPAEGGDQSHRPGDFVSHHPGVDSCAVNNAQSWACTRERGHSGEHIASEGEFTLAIWGAAPEPLEDAPEATTQAPPPLTRGRVVRAVRMYPGYVRSDEATQFVGRLGISMQERPDHDGDVKVAFLVPDVPLSGVTADQAERQGQGVYYAREWETLTDEEVAAHDADLTPPVHAREGATAQEKLDALWEALGKEANERGWCSEYDQFAARHGGPERPTEWNVRVRLRVGVPREHVVAGYTGTGRYAVTYEVTVRVTGATEEVARERTPAALLAAGWKGDLAEFVSVNRRAF